MHSCSIIVESMSARRRRLRRCRAGCATTSIGSPASAARRPARRSSRSPSAKSRSAAISPCRRCGGWSVASARRAARSTASVMAGARGFAMRVATRVTAFSMLDRGAVLIAGPTASGKSALALDLARRLDGVAINADPRQVYRALRTLPARPAPQDEALAPPRLYGHVDGAVNFSVGHSLRDAAEALAEARAAGRLPIFVGGTGLYFKAL